MQPASAGALWPRWFYEVLHPGFARMRNTSERSSTWLSPTRHANIRMDICQIGYDICEFDSLRGLGIDVIGRVHFDNRDRFAIWMGSIGDRTMSTNEWLLTSDFWQFLEPWHGRWCEYEIFIAWCTDNIYDLENERWLLGTWLIMLGFMDLGWPRVYRRSTSVLSRIKTGLYSLCAYSHTYTDCRRSCLYLCRWLRPAHRHA